MFIITRPDTAFSLDPSSKKTRRMVDDNHLAFIRLLPSVISGKTPCEASHIRTGDALWKKKHTGKGQKPDDCWTLPMTREEHAKQHSMNEMEFWKSHGIDPFQLASDLYRVSGDLEAGREIIKGK